jgi:hypothetical protein
MVMGVMISLTTGDGVGLSAGPSLAPRPGPVLLRTNQAGQQDCLKQKANENTQMHGPHRPILPKLMPLGSQARLRRRPIAPWPRAPRRRSLRCPRKTSFITTRNSLEYWRESDGTNKN